MTLEVLALDTEFERTRTYYSRPALVQVYDGDRVTLIDPLEIDDFAPLGELLQCPEATNCLLYTSPSPRDATLSRMPSSA